MKYAFLQAPSHLEIWPAGSEGDSTTGGESSTLCVILVAIVFWLEDLTGLCDQPVFTSCTVQQIHHFILCHYILSKPFDETYWLNKLVLLTYWKYWFDWIILDGKAQRHNGPEDWVHITRSQFTVHKSWTYYNFRISTSILTKSKVKILTTPGLRILSDIQLRNLNQISAAKYWPNFSSKILTNLNTLKYSKIL